MSRHGHRRCGPAAGPAAAPPRTSPSVFFRGSIRPTERTNGSGPHRSRNGSGDAVAERRGARRWARRGSGSRGDAEEPGQLVGLGLRIGQDDVRQMQQLAPPRRDARRHRCAGTTPPARRPSARLGSSARDRPGLVPADRRERHRHAARPRQPRQLEPLARHPEEMEQPRRLQAVGPRRRTAGRGRRAPRDAGPSGRAGSRRRPAPGTRRPARAGTPRRRRIGPRLRAASHAASEGGDDRRPAGALHERGPSRVDASTTAAHASTRFGSDDRGISPSGVTVSQSIAVRTACLEARAPAARSSADRARPASLADRW